MSNMKEKSNGWRSCLELGQSQIASETVHGAKLVAELSNCATCVEENKKCKCEGSSRVLSLEAEHNTRANSSFAHSVINMVGMLIGIFQQSSHFSS